jgi:hypothetical protein
MDSKLTLKLDEGAIEQAKAYAQRRGTSLSRLVESYFVGLTRREGTGDRKPVGVVAELAGLLTAKAVDTTKEGYAEYLSRKYS